MYRHTTRWPSGSSARSTALRRVLRLADPRIPTCWPPKPEEWRYASCPAEQRWKRGPAPLLRDHRKQHWSGTLWAVSDRPYPQPTKSFPHSEGHAQRAAELAQNYAKARCRPNVPHRDEAEDDNARKKLHPEYLGRVHFRNPWCCFHKMPPDASCAPRQRFERPDPDQVPTPQELPERLGAVLQVIYLVFNEGYSAAAGAEVTRAELKRRPTMQRWAEPWSKSPS